MKLSRHMDATLKPVTFFDLFVHQSESQLVFNILLFGQLWAVFASLSLPKRLISLIHHCSCLPGMALVAVYPQLFKKVLAIPEDFFSDAEYR